MENQQSVAQSSNLLNVSTAREGLFRALSANMASVLAFNSTTYLGDTAKEWGYPTWVEPDSNKERRQLNRRFSMPSWALRRIDVMEETPSPVSSRRNEVLREAALSVCSSPTSQTTDRTNIFNLRPRDIKLLVCFGDSLLSGLCVTAHPLSIKNQLLSAVAQSGCSKMIPWILSAEHRQNTCISGGKNGVISVGKMLRHFSKDLVGLNEEVTYLFSHGSGFNFSRSGSTSDDLTEQISTYIQKIRKPKYRYLQSEWKLVYIWIGANDVFTKKDQTISNSFEKNLIDALKSLSVCASKSFVCVLTLPNLSNHIVSTHPQDEIQNKTRLVNKILHRVVDLYSWNDPDYFRVELQPIPFESVDEKDKSQWISQLDLIHPSFFAQQLFAKSIWNNLFLPREQKMTSKSQVVQSEWHNPDREDDYLM